MLCSQLAMQTKTVPWRSGKLNLPRTSGATTQIRISDPVRRPTNRGMALELSFFDMVHNKMLTLMFFLVSNLVNVYSLSFG
jgi:hypothetical protein